MARGKLLKTKIKEQKALIKARLQAKKEWNERKSNLLYHLKNWLIETGKHVDPVNIAAIGATMPVVYLTLKTAEEFMDLLKGNVEQITKIAIGLPPILGPFFQFWYTMLKPEDVPEAPDIKASPEWMLLSISFVISYIIVNHPEVITSMFQSTAGVIGFATGLIT